MRSAQSHCSLFTAAYLLSCHRRRHTHRHRERARRERKKEGERIPTTSNALSSTDPGTRPSGAKRKTCANKQFSKTQNQTSSDLTAISYTPIKAQVICSAQRKKERKKKPNMHGLQYITEKSFRFLEHFIYIIFINHSFHYALYSRSTK